MSCRCDAQQQKWCKMLVQCDTGYVDRTWCIRRCKHSSVVFIRKELVALLNAFSILKVQVLPSTLRVLYEY
jgi:hypothetical protein